VKTYFESLVFYFLEMIGGGINFLCSLIRVYPKLDLGVDYLAKMYSKQYTQENDDQVARRRKLHEEGDTKFADAKDIL